MLRTKKQTALSISLNKNMIKTKHHTIRPKGAHKLDDFFLKLIYPVCVQRKLDGYRCLAHFNKSIHKFDLFTRTMKSYSHLPHIREELLKINNLLLLY